METEGYDGAFARTAKLLADSRQPVFEAGFQAEGALAFADMMLPESDKGQPARAFQVSRRDTAHLLENRGLKPTATVIRPAGTTYFTFC